MTTATKPRVTSFAPQFLVEDPDGYIVCFGGRSPA
jgi:hypothetical protein